MKRQVLAIFVSCVALLAVWHFAGGVASRVPPNQNPRNESPTATASSAGQHSATGASTATSRAAAQVQESTGGVWQGFLNWIGLRGRQGRDAQPIRRVNLGEAQRTSRDARDRFPPSIAGRVLDEAGQPVSGMQVSAELLRPFQAQEGTSDIGMVAQVSSDLAGAYRFDQLQEGEYRLKTVATALYMPAEVVVRTGIDSVDIVVSGERRISIQGLVSDIRGKPLNGVRVSTGQKPPLEASTDQDGNYQLETLVSRSDRNFLLKFQLEGYRKEERELNESQMYGQSIVHLNATLSPTRSLTAVAGKVSNREGTPLSGEIVHLLGAVRYHATTDRAGQFVIPEVDGGQYYRFQVPSRSPYRPYVKQVFVGPDGLWQDVVMERGSPKSGPLSGRMMDLAGNPLPRFSLWLQSYNPEARMPVQVTSDDRGFYSIDEIPLGSLSFMTQSQPRFLIRGFNLPEGGAQNVDLILDWGAYEVTGQVLDSEGVPVLGSRIKLSWSYQNSGMQSQSERETAADAAGFFRFAQVGPGVHSVRVWVQGYRSVLLDYNVGRDSGAVVVQLERDAQAAFIR